MKFGVVGLGRMGLAIADRVHKAGIPVVGYDPYAGAQQAARDLGMTVVESLQALAAQATVIWLMVPQGTPVDDAIVALVPNLLPDTIIIDGRNSYYKDSQRRALQLQKINVPYLDCGTSGGVHGHEQGFCLMIGGSRVAYDTLVPLLRIIAAPNGYAYIGVSGTGHYVKMVHNGIEYGLLQAYGEGFEIIKNGTFASEHIDLAALTQLWNNGSVIRSWILSLAHDVFARDQALQDVDGKIDQGGTGTWTYQEAQKHTISAPILKTSLDVRAASQVTGGSYATKVVAMLRNAFGGHRVHHKGHE